MIFNFTSYASSTARHTTLKFDFWSTISTAKTITALSNSFIDGEVVFTCSYYLSIQTPLIKLSINFAIIIDFFLILYYANSTCFTCESVSRIPPFRSSPKAYIFSENSYPTWFFSTSLTTSRMYIIQMALSTIFLVAIVRITWICS